MAASRPGGIRQCTAPQLHAGNTFHSVAPQLHPSMTHRSIALGVCLARVLPCLGQHPIVPVDVVGVEAQLALLGVLLDGVQQLVLCTKTRQLLQNFVKLMRASHSLNPCNPKLFVRYYEVYHYCDSNIRRESDALGSYAGCLHQAAAVSKCVLKPPANLQWPPPSWLRTPWGSH